MATLVSPGVSVTVIDESQYASAGQGTIPLIFIATASNKLIPDGTAIAPGTQEDGVLRLITSQRELLQTYGAPSFETVDGSVVQGSETSEYGLHAAYSYLGVANRAYVIRAGVDLSQLVATQTAPRSAPANGTYWFDLTATSFGIFRANGNTTPGLAWDVVTPLIPTATQVDGSFVPLSSFGTDGDIAVVTLNTLNTVYQKTAGTWEVVGGSAWLASHSGGSLFYSSHVSIPSGSNTGSIWIKITDPNYGANYTVKRYSTTTGQFATVAAPFYANDAAANTAYGINKTIGSLYVQYNASGTNLAPIATQTIKRWDGSNWSVLSYEPNTVAPTAEPVAGTLWLNNDFKVDIMVNDGNEWKGYLVQFPATDPAGVQITSEEPTAQSDGSPLVDNDLWLKSDDLVNYPALYRWNNSSSSWTLIDKTDQTTPFGIVFGDVRQNDDGTKNGSEAVADLLVSNYVDPGTLNPETFPAGMLIFNTRYSTNNVKQWNPAFYQGQGSYTVGAASFAAPTYVGRWVTVSGNRANGAPYMGRFAQHQMVVKAIQEMVVANDDIRSEFVFFNLMAAPGYPELINEMQELNLDRKETAFIIADTPLRLNPSSSALNNWAINTAGAEDTNEFGRTTRYTYAAEYYPHGLGTNTDGNNIAIPSSTIALRTYAYNDSVAYPWTPPAGTQRGVVQNASSLGYVTAENEFQTVSLNPGQRDTLYLNNINPITNLPNRGLVVYGDKTLHPEATALDRVNVARLICYLRYQLDQLAQPFLFELNVDSTRQAVESAFKRYLGDLLSVNAITDFAVVCDTTNNTNERIDRNELWIDLAIVPAKSINFIYIPIRIKNTGEI